MKNGWKFWSKLIVNKGGDIQEELMKEKWMLSRKYGGAVHNQTMCP